MQTEPPSIEFKLEDMIGGQPLTLETVDLPTLRGFLEDVEKLVKGDVPGASLADSKVRLESGSLRVHVVAGQSLIDNLNDDLSQLQETGDLDTLQPKRAEVIEQWQKRALRNASRTYSIVRPDMPPSSALYVSNDSRYQHSGKNSWVEVTRYLSGQVVDIGGKSVPIVHLVLADTGKSIRVNATRKQLETEPDNQLYRDVTLKVQTEQHLRTHELRNIRLVEFLRHAGEVDEEALQRLWQKGAEAWRDVESASAWVESLRGD